MGDCVHRALPGPSLGCALWELHSCSLKKLLFCFLLSLQSSLQNENKPKNNLPSVTILETLLTISYLLKCSYPTSFLLHFFKIDLLWDLYWKSISGSCRWSWPPFVPQGTLVNLKYSIITRLHSGCAELRVPKTTSLVTAWDLLKVKAFCFLSTIISETATEMRVLSSQQWWNKENDGKKNSFPVNATPAVMFFSN